MATGGGKSLVYQYCSQFVPGLVLVVTPLISLMTDQLLKLPSFITGACLNSNQTPQQKSEVHKAIVDKKVKVLFVSPERFFMEDFTKFNRKVSMVCVDEIHCASEWSHNFRPTYLKLHDMVRDKLEDPVILGLTATATRATQLSICTQFGIKAENIVTVPDLARLNLNLSITRDEDKERGLLNLIKSDLYKNFKSVLVFVTQRRTADNVAHYLSQNGVSSKAYHAGKSDAERQYV